MLGTFSAPKPVDLQRLMMKEVALLGSFCYGTGDREPEFATAARAHGPVARQLPRAHHPPVRPRRRRRAFATAGDKATGAIKVTLTV